MAALFGIVFRRALHKTSGISSDRSYAVCQRLVIQGEAVGELADPG